MTASSSPPTPCRRTGTTRSTCGKTRTRTTCGPSWATGRPLNQALNALPWETTPAAAATTEISRGRIETRTVRVLPAPAGTGFEDARQALLIERYTTYKKKGKWHTRAEAT